MPYISLRLSLLCKELEEECNNIKLILYIVLGRNNLTITKSDWVAPN